MRLIRGLHTVITCCHDSLPDSLMRFYLTQAKDEGIRVEVSLPLPKQLPVPESDVCVLLGNLLENALSACRKLSPSQDRYIRVHGLFTPPHALSFTVDNGFCPQSNKTQSSEQSETKVCPPAPWIMTIRGLALDSRLSAPQPPGWVGLPNSSRRKRNSGLRCCYWARINRRCSTES